LTGGAGDGGSAPAAPAAVAPDPFAPKAAGGGLGGGGGSSLPTRGTASAILAANGISFPEGSSATFIAATSQLIVKNTQPNLDAVEAFVDSLLKKIPQMISISAKFVEVSQKNTDELGFDWLIGAFNVGAPGVFASGGTSGNSANGPIASGDYPTLFPGSSTPVGQFPLTAGSRSGSAAITPNSIDGQIQGTGLQTTQKAPGIFSITGVFTDPQFQVVIRALSQKKGVDLMSAPSVTTRSGQRASVEVVREFIYPTEFSPPQLPQSSSQTSLTGVTPPVVVAPTTPSAFTMRPVGVKMEVEPVIGPDGYTIDLNLAPEVTEFDGFINYGSPINTVSTDALGLTRTVTLSENKIQQPIFSLRKVQTAVTVWDGQTVAMGGLIREDVQDKVPILGDLPLVGRLFQTKAQDHFKRNLMVFVTAKLIDPSGQPIRNTGGSTTTTTTVTTPPPMEGVSAIPGVPGVLTPIK
ncbi:MAG: type II and III secretion system protein, partial [Verrucomicrobia bacterium]|nr:type II and III secretion system protein [Verrucomicrobiota bacterium]